MAKRVQYQLAYFGKGSARLRSCGCFPSSGSLIGIHIISIRVFWSLYIRVPLFRGSTTCSGVWPTDGSNDAKQGLKASDNVIEDFYESIKQAGLGF